MSEYFFWANIDKKQFLSPSDFGYGSRLHESMHREHAPMSALYALLSTEWNGDRVLFLGDEGEMPFPPGYDVFQLINCQIQDYNQGDYHYYDLMIETYWNLSALPASAGTPAPRSAPDGLWRWGWRAKSAETAGRCERCGHGWRPSAGAPFR